MTTTRMKTNPLRLILASASPRRQELLREAGYAFEVHPADLDESDHPTGLDPAALAAYLADRKAEAVAARFPDAVVLAADTVVALGSRALGKPADAKHAREMLASLAGTNHAVVTGVTVLCRSRGVRGQTVVTSSVYMRPLSRAEIDAYVATGHWQGKAGGYGIQDRDPFVIRITGSLTNIVGLPMDETKRLLQEAGVES
jgi:nucleoside triphosphate pyrophosphatase